MNNNNNKQNRSANLTGPQPVVIVDQFTTKDKQRRYSLISIEDKNTEIKNLLKDFMTNNNHRFISKDIFDKVKLEDTTIDGLSIADMKKTLIDNAKIGEDYNSSTNSYSILFYFGIDGQGPDEDKNYACKSSEKTWDNPRINFKRDEYVGIGSQNESEFSGGREMFYLLQDFSYVNYDKLTDGTYTIVADTSDGKPQYDYTNNNHILIASDNGAKLKYVLDEIEVYSLSGSFFLGKKNLTYY